METNTTTLTWSNPTQTLSGALRRALLLATALATFLAVLAPAADARGELAVEAERDATAEICIVEGANICPPEPIENIVLCITTSQLAGYECPDFNKDEVVLSLDFAVKTTDDGRTQAALPAGDCSGVAECNDFIAECIGAGGKYVPEHHNEQGQPNLGHCE